MAVSFSIAELVGLSVETYIFGIFSVLLGQCFAVLYRQRNHLSRAYISITVLATILGVLITWHAIIDAVRLVFAFKASQTTIGADLYYANAAGTLSVMKTAVYLVTTIIFDAFMLYRCFLVWNYNLVVVVTMSIVYLADVGTGIADTHGLSQLNSADSVFIARLAEISKSFFSVTLVVNGLCTLLIAYRVWERHYILRDPRISWGITRELIIIAESGMLYTTNLIIVVSLYTSQSNVFNVFLDMASPIIGVAFCLIVLRTTTPSQRVPTQMSLKDINADSKQDSAQQDSVTHENAPV